MTGVIDIYLEKEGASEGEVVIEYWDGDYSRRL